MPAAGEPFVVSRSVFVLSLIITSKLMRKPALCQSDSMNFSKIGAFERSDQGFDAEEQ